MRFAEYDYLTKGLQLIANKRIERNYYDEEIEPIEKGQIVNFSDFGMADRNALEVTINNEIMIIDSYDFSIDYLQVDTPNLNELNEMEEEDLEKIQVGDKLISGETDEGTIGAGQIVEVLKVHRYSTSQGSNEFVGATVKDKFGNEEKIYSFYHLADKQEVNPYIVNPAKDIVESGITVQVDKNNLNDFIKTLTGNLKSERTTSELTEQDVLNAIALTLKGE